MVPVLLWKGRPCLAHPCHPHTPLSCLPAPVHPAPRLKAPPSTRPQQLCVPPTLYASSCLLARVGRLQLTHNVLQSAGKSPMPTTQTSVGRTVLDPSLHEDLEMQAAQ